MSAVERMTADQRQILVQALARAALMRAIEADRRHSDEREANHKSEPVRRTA